MAASRARLVGASAILAAVMLLSPVAASAADITLAWDASPGTIAGYKVYWGTASGIYTSSAPVGAQTTWTVRGLTAGVRYYFIVKAYSELGAESESSNEVSTIVGEISRVPFTDDPLLPGVHSMRLVHITELRERIDALRVARSLAPMAWTPLVAHSTLIDANHIAQLRAGLAAVYTSLGHTAPAYANDPLAPGTPLKAAHIAQLRDAVKSVEQ